MYPYSKTRVKSSTTTKKIKVAKPKEIKKMDGYNIAFE